MRSDRTRSFASSAAHGAYLLQKPNDRTRSFASAAALAPGALSWLAFDLGAAGEPWRAVTGHLVHISFDHLAWDLGAFLVLGLLCEHAWRTRYLICLAASAVAIPAALCLLQPQLSSYCGLSGIDSALFGLLAVRSLQRGISLREGGITSVAAVLLAAFVAKLVFEHTAGATVFVDSANAVPVPLAHAAGVLIGAATALSATLCLETALIGLALYASLNAPSGTQRLAGAST